MIKIHDSEKGEVNLICKRKKGLTEEGKKERKKERQNE
jgi:hypothetical protein